MTVFALPSCAAGRSQRTPPGGKRNILRIFSRGRSPAWCSNTARRIRRPPPTFWIGCCVIYSAECFSGRHETPVAPQTPTFALKGHSKASLFPVVFASFNVSAAIAQFIITDAVIFKIRQDVVHGRLGNVIQGFFRQKGLMGGDNHIGH